MSVCITTCPIDNNYIVTTELENISNVTDKLIYLAAKWTEHHASDIIDVINDLNKAIDAQKSHDVLLFFHGKGVVVRDTKSFDDYEFIKSNYHIIQTWQLTYNPETTETKLMPVMVWERKEYVYF